MRETLRFIVETEKEYIKAGVYLRTVCKLSARTLALLKREQGSLLRNGELLRTIDLLKQGDVVTITLPEEQNTITATKGEPIILYEDDYLLVVNKPPFMPVHPVKVHQLNTLANIIAYRYKELGDGFVFRASNRLDKDTSGAVLISKDRHTASLLQNTEIIKHYTAVCYGRIEEKMTISEPIGLADGSKILRCVTPDGKNAVTHLAPINVFEDATLLDLTLETGRTHQIRCHLSHIGHPLMGDDLYGGKRELINRQALHCKSVEFIHPLSGSKIYAEAPLFDDMENLIKIKSRE